MAILDHEHPERYPPGIDPRSVAGVDEETKCFLCGMPLGALPIIYWTGGDGDPSDRTIAFHPRCATSFVLRLARDCWEYEGRER